MKSLSMFFLLLVGTLTYAGYETGTADQVLRVPGAGGRPQYGQLDLSKTAATKNQLLTSRGGLGIDASASTGACYMSSGATTIGILPQSAGGLGSGSAFTLDGIFYASSTSAAATTGAGTSGQVMTSNGSGTPPSFQTLVSSNQSPIIQNVGLATSVATNALTIALKQSDGTTDPSTGNASAVIGTRSSTVTSGAFNTRSVSSALSIIVPSGTTLGTLNSTNAYIYVYAIDNAGTIELAVSLSALFDNGTVVTTTAISGGASRDILYSTTARTNVAVRLIGRILIFETTAGTWASNAIEVSVRPFENRSLVYASYLLSANFTASTTVPINFDSKEFDEDSNVSVSPTAWKFTAPTNGLYQIDLFAEAQSNASIGIYKNGVLYRYLTYSLSASNAISATMKVKLAAGDFIDIRPNSSVVITGSATANGVNTARIVITRDQIF